LTTHFYAGYTLLNFWPDIRPKVPTNNLDEGLNFGAYLVLTSAKKHQIGLTQAKDKMQKSLGIRGFIAIGKTRQQIIRLIRNDGVVSSILTASSKNFSPDMKNVRAYFFGLIQFF